MLSDFMVYLHLLFMGAGAEAKSPVPNPMTIPYVWKYDVIKPYLRQAGYLIIEKQVGRRGLMLENLAKCESLTLGSFSYYLSKALL